MAVMARARAILSDVGQVFAVSGLGVVFARDRTLYLRGVVSEPFEVSVSMSVLRARDHNSFCGPPCGRWRCRQPVRGRVSGGRIGYRDLLLAVLVGQCRTPQSSNLSASELAMMSAEQRLTELKSVAGLRRTGRTCSPEQPPATRFALLPGQRAVGGHTDPLVSCLRDIPGANRTSACPMPSTQELATVRRPSASMR